MTRLPNETDHEYKARVLDTKSASFCAAKWYNATIWLGSGMTTSCHHPLPHKVPVEAVLANPKALHNTEQKKDDRRQMQCGQRPGGCNYCWTVEDLGQNNISDRVYKTIIYTDESVDLAFNTPPNDDVDLQTLEISFDRTCNFACSYCNPAFSSSWVKDIKENGPYEGLESDGRNHFTHAHDSSQLYGYGEKNPYVDAFFKWWESDLHKTLQELRVTGGEPLTSPETWKLLDWFRENNTDMRFALNSNLGVKGSSISRLIETTWSLKHFHLYTSCESVGAKAEYIRDGLVWKDWKANVEEILDTAKIEGFHMMCTINALCLDGLIEFLDQLLDWKKEYGRDYPTFTLNILRFPSFQSAAILPIQIRATYALELRAWLANAKKTGLLHEMEINQTQRLIDFLQEVQYPHTDSDGLNTMRNDFRKFYQQYDERRGKDFCKTFPILKEFYLGR
jgi:organic radical activating enzyme